MTTSKSFVRSVVILEDSYLLFLILREIFYVLFLKTPILKELKLRDNMTSSNSMNRIFYGADF